MFVNQFQRLAAALTEPSPAPAKPAPSPYPWSDEEMIARYSLRQLTAEEKQVFPGLRLVLDVFKAKLIKPPSAVLRVRAGWAFGELSRAVVWVAETYPGCYHVRLPGAASLLVPYHDITWEHVPAETPATTVEDIRAEERWLEVEAGKWRPGQTITTPGTRLSWDSLAGWIDGWRQLQGRAHSSDRYMKESDHIRALPAEMIAAETDQTVLYDFLHLMNDDNARPPKGMRAEHPTTPLVMAAHNRLAQLETVPYRQYRQQQSLHRALARTAEKPTRKRPPGEKAASHLSLF
jgi:hypothetical protein